VVLRGQGVCGGGGGDTRIAKGFIKGEVSSSSSSSSTVAGLS